MKRLNGLICSSYWWPQDLRDDMGWITEKPNRYPIFLKTDTEYRTDFYNKKAVLSQRWPRDARYFI